MSAKNGGGQSIKLNKENKEFTGRSGNYSGNIINNI